VGYLRSRFQCSRFYICIINSGCLRIFNLRHYMCGRLLSIDYNARSINKYRQLLRPAKHTADTVTIRCSYLDHFQVVAIISYSLRTRSASRCLRHTTVRLHLWRTRSLCKQMPQERGVKAYRRCEVWGSHRGTDHDSGILGCDDVSERDGRVFRFREVSDPFLLFDFSDPNN
jgi:hypothetical protein